MKPSALIPFLILPIATAALTVGLLMDHSAAPATVGAPLAALASDLDVERELSDGCERLVALAGGDSTAAPWALAELQRAATAPWASAALRAQARRGLDRVADQRVSVARR